MVIEQAMPWWLVVSSHVHQPPFFPADLLLLSFASQTKASHSSSPATTLASSSTTAVSSSASRFPDLALTIPYRSPPPYESELGSLLPRLHHLLQPRRRARRTLGHPLPQSLSTRYSQASLTVLPQLGWQDNQDFSLPLGELGGNYERWDLGLGLSCRATEGH